VEIASQVLRPMVLCHLAEIVTAIPIHYVVETLRPLSLAAFEGMADPLLGVAVIRGKLGPVVSGRMLLGLPSGPAPTRWVVLRVGERLAALAVDSVIGVRTLDAAIADSWPELANHIAAEKVSAIGLLDRRLLMCLQAARLVDEAVWQNLASALSKGVA
jgi:purine-binding chemotaxis protein CheW